MPSHDPLPEARRAPRRAAPVPPGSDEALRDAEVSSEDDSPAEPDGVSVEPDPSGLEGEAPHELDADADAGAGEEGAGEEASPDPDGEDRSPSDAGADLVDAAGAQRDAELPGAPPASTGGETTSVPPPSAVRSLGPPLLASQALMEDLAPVEPLGQRARILCVVAGLLFALFGALPLAGVPLAGHPALIPSLVVGAVTLFAAVARVTYRMRAVAMVVLGAIVAGLGIAGTGPAQGIAEGGIVWSLARFAAVALLPAAVLFRARYRAFDGARLLLGLAFVAALPYAIHAVIFLLGPSFGFAQIGAILVLLLLVAGLPGFMGSETTAAGSYVAPAMIAAFALQAGLQRLGALVPGSLSEVFAVVETIREDGEVSHAIPAASLTAGALLDAAVTAVALAASALLSALGLFQILAWKFAPAARKIDIRRTPAEATERPSIEEWSTRH